LRVSHLAAALKTSFIENAEGILTIIRVCWFPQHIKKRKYMTQLIQRKEDPERKLTKAEAQKKLDAQSERDHETVTGVFRFLEMPGSTLRFMFQKYLQDGFIKYELTDGQIYKLPRMVARHLNQNVYYRHYTHLDKRLSDNIIQQASLGTSDKDSQMYAIEKIPRCEFKSLEFMDDDLELNPSKLTEVKKVH
jgi:hypothetical protein